jgi:hypothetical protein
MRGFGYSVDRSESCRSPAERCSFAGQDEVPRAGRMLLVVLKSSRTLERTTRSQEGNEPLEGSESMLGPGRTHSARRRDRLTSSRGHVMAAERGTGGNTGGIGLGGILVIVGIVLMIVWSFWVGLIVTLVGLIAFGGFAKGKWY